MGIIKKGAFFLFIITCFITTSAQANFSGNLDLSFGVDGFSINDFSPTSDDDEIVKTFIVNTVNGEKILAVGKTSVPGQRSNIVLARYNLDGSLDASFGVGGFVIHHLGYNEMARSAAVSDTHIYVTGILYHHSSLPSPSGTTDLFVAKFSLDGAVDTSFGTNGIAIRDEGSIEYGQDIILNSLEGVAIVVSDKSLSGGKRDLHLNAFLLSDGSHQMGFQFNHLTSLPASISGDGDISLVPNTFRDFGIKLLQDSNYNFYLVSKTSASNDRNKIVVWKFYYDSDDTDQSVDFYGKLTYDFSPDAVHVSPVDAIWDASDRLVVLSNVTGESSENTPGIAWFDKDSLSLISSSLASLPMSISAKALALDDSKRLYALGLNMESVYDPDNPMEEEIFFNWMSARFLPSMNVDPSYGSGGIAIQYDLNFENVYSLIQYDDDLILAGESGDPDDSTLVKLFGNGTSSVCGDNTQSGIEECDDGNLEDGDGCSHMCEIEEDPESEDVEDDEESEEEDADETDPEESDEAEDDDEVGSDPDDLLDPVIVDPVDDDPVITPDPGEGEKAESSGGGGCQLNASHSNNTWYMVFFMIPIFVLMFFRRVRRN